MGGLRLAPRDDRGRRGAGDPPQPDSLRNLGANRAVILHKAVPNGGISRRIWQRQPPTGEDARRDRHPRRHDACKQRRDALGSLARHFHFAENINLKAVDHIDGTPAIRQLTARRLADVSVHECWSGPCTVEQRPSAQAPVHRLPVVEMLDGFHWRADFTLVEGRVIHDYLAK